MQKEYNLWEIKPEQNFIYLWFASSAIDHQRREWGSEASRQTRRALSTGTRHHRPPETDGATSATTHCTLQQQPLRSENSAAFGNFYQGISSWQSWQCLGVVIKKNFGVTELSIWFSRPLNHICYTADLKSISKNPYLSCAGGVNTPSNPTVTFFIICK